MHSVVMQIDTSASPWCLFAQPLHTVVCSLSITLTVEVAILSVSHLQDK